MSSDSQYQEKLAAEAELWGANPSAWRKVSRPIGSIIAICGIMSSCTPGILMRFWLAFKPGMNVLELGCASGWLTLAMAERGAHATGLDLSEKSLVVARSYYESVKERVHRNGHLSGCGFEYFSSFRRIPMMSSP